MHDNTPPHDLTQVLNAALEVSLQQGCAVFPCKNNKAPACPTGFKASSNDPEIIRQLWTKHPAPLIGVPTGHAFDVLDIDPKNGGMDWLNRYRDHLPPTRTHVTRSSGLHIFYASHPGLRCSSSKLAPGVDVRASGGYIIWWPATRLKIFGPIIPAEWPSWLLRALHEPKASYSPRAQADSPLVPSTDAYARSALMAATRNVVNAAEGARNNTLNRETWSLMRFVAVGKLTVQQICNQMASAGLAVGLTPREIEATLASAMCSRSEP